MVLAALSNLTSNQILYFNNQAIQIRHKKPNFSNKHTINKITNVAKILHQADEEIKNSQLSNQQLFVAYENATRKYVHLKAKIENCNIFKQLIFKIVQIFSGHNLDKEFHHFQRDVFTKINLDQNFFEYLQNALKSDADFFFIEKINKDDFKPLSGEYSEDGSIIPDPIVRILNQQIKKDRKVLKNFPEKERTLDNKDFLQIYDRVFTNAFCFSLFILKKELPRCLPLVRAVHIQETKKIKVKIEHLWKEEPRGIEKYVSCLLKLLEQVPQGFQRDLLYEGLKKISKNDRSMENAFKIEKIKMECQTLFYDTKRNLREELSQLDLNYPNQEQILTLSGIYQALVDKENKLDQSTLKFQYHDLISEQGLSYIPHHFFEFANLYCYYRDNFFTPAFYEEGTKQSKWRELYNILYKEVDVMVDAQQFNETRDRNLFPGPDTSQEAWDSYKKPPLTAEQISEVYRKNR